MLLQNKRLLYQTPGFFFGGSAIAVSNSFVKNYRGRFISESEFDKKASMPLGTEGEYSYVLAQKGGGLATYTDILGSGSLTASQSNGINISANLEGGGTLTANANLITSMMANLAGSGSLSASAVGTVSLAANLVGSGDLVGGLKMFAGLVAELHGSSSLTSTMKGFANMSADIYVNQSEASVQQLVDGVWNAVATEYNNPGTMGEAVQTGGGGGGGGATAAQIWSYSTRTLTESAGLTPEQAEQLERVDSIVSQNLDQKVSEVRGGSGGFLNVQGLQETIRNTGKKTVEDVSKKIEEAKEELKQEIEEKNIDLEPIISKIDSIDDPSVYKELNKGIGTIKSQNTKLSQKLEVIKDIQEQEKKKQEKKEENLSKIYKTEAEEIENEYQKMFENEAEEIESEMEALYRQEAEEIEKELKQ